MASRRNSAAWLNPVQKEQAEKQVAQGPHGEDLSDTRPSRSRATGRPVPGRSLGVNLPQPDCTAAYRGCSAVRTIPGCHLGSRAEWEEDQRSRGLCGEAGLLVGAVRPGG